MYDYDQFLWCNQEGEGEREGEISCQTQMSLSLNHVETWLMDLSSTTILNFFLSHSPLAIEVVKKFELIHQKVNQRLNFGQGLKIVPWYTQKKVNQTSCTALHS